jgi:hypothetical protein
MKKCHLFDVGDIAASIADGVKVTAVCGRRRVVTKKTWDKSRGVPMCRECVDLWAVRQDGTTIRNRSPRDQPPKKPTHTWSVLVTTTYGGAVTWREFPPAA